MAVIVNKKLKPQKRPEKLPSRTSKTAKTIDLPWQIIVYELSFKIITGLCLVPFFVFLINFFLKISGYSYISSRNISSLISNPMTIVCLFGIGIISAFMILIEISILTLYFGHDFKGKQLQFSKLLFLSVKEIRRIIKPKNIILIFYVICIIPIINFITISSTLVTNTQIPEIIIDYIKKSETLTVLTIVFIILVFILSVQMIFVFCYFFLEHKSLADSFTCSRLLIKGKVIKTIGYIFICNVFFVFVYVLFYLLIIGLVTMGVKLFDVQRLAFAIFLSLFNMTNKIVLLIISSLEIVTNFSLTVHLYLRYSGKGKKRYPLSFEKNETKKKYPFKIKGVLALMVIGTTILNGIGIYYIIHEDYSLLNGEKTQITSHRGNSILAPENTLVALEYAIRDLSDYAEIDVQETKDGEIIVFHDASLKRITGINKNIWTLNYNEIKDLDVGSWFSKEFVDVRIPTLDEAIKFSKGRIKLNIEIKPTGHDKNLEESVVRLIEENDFVDECVVTSFNYKSLTKIKKLNENIKTGYILSAVYGNFYDLKNADFFSMERNFVNERIVIETHKRGKEIHVWTVNREHYIDRLAAIGVDNIITDDPVMARTIIYSREIPEYTLNLLKLIFDTNLKKY